MLHDPTPVYPHLQHLTWAHEPLKSVYVSQRLFTTLLLVPLWAIYYAVLPRSFRPRPSWSPEVAGVTWGTRDPTQEPDETSLNETRFAWVPPLPDELRTGVVDDNEVQCLRVGTFIWPRVPSPAVRMRGLLQGGGGSAAEDPKYIPDNVPVSSKFNVDDCITASSTPASQYPLPKVSELDVHLPEVLHSNGDADVEADAVDSPPHMIGIYLHGGGYCHMSAHESSGTSRIPRRLIKDNLFEEIHAVEYRLLQHAPIPGALQDAAAVYAHLVTHHLAYRPRIILIGDSAGGNLVLALSRWIRDEGVLPVPDGMLLLSPSCDPSHTLPQVPASRRPRPHADTDYLLDTPEPRALLSLTFLGHHPVEMVYSPYVSPASEWVLSVFHGMTEGMVDLEPLGPHRDSRDYRDEGIKTEQYGISVLPPGMGLFTEFPRAMIVVGDAERLERERSSTDGVRVRMVWAKDAVHDILIMGAWDERVREGVWNEIGKWVREVVAE
ncbi:Alpha/Beta hydrolase protein [Lactarius pseudohatsudake]|nr:Alpha/Beta hydrolase protein [Lactarius pseudohatsudake]